jgi:hypothetical protein
VEKIDQVLDECGIGSTGCQRTVKIQIGFDDDPELIVASAQRTADLRDSCPEAGGFQRFLEQLQWLGPEMLCDADFDRLPALAAFH